MTAWVFVTVLLINKPSEEVYSSVKGGRAGPFCAVCMSSLKPTAELTARVTLTTEQRWARLNFKEMCYL